MTYTVARYSVEAGGWVEINGPFNTYSEADEWHEHYSNIYDFSVVKVVKSDDCI